MLPFFTVKDINTNRFSINNKPTIIKKNIYSASINALNAYLLYFSLILTFVLIKQSNASTLICIFKDGTITIGVDSKATITNFADTTVIINCKIFQVDSFFIAFSGISNYDKTNFSLSKIAKNTLTTITNTIETKIKTFQETLLQEFIEAIEHMKEYNPSIFLDSLVVKRLRCSVFVLGIFNENPFVYSIQYKVYANPTRGIADVVDVGVNKKFNGPFSNGHGRIVAGEREHIYEFEKSDTTYWKRNDPVDVINFFIGIEIKHSSSVGPPIDILQINSKGWQWIQRKKECHDYDS